MDTTDVVENAGAAFEELGEREALIGDAAIAVLAAEGGRGLTHRAVDRHAGLPEGSTSNYFQTREALLTGALRRMVELEAPSIRALEELVPYGPYDAREAAELLAEQMRGWLEPPNDEREVARFELYLEARRRPQFQKALNEVRRSFTLRTERLLPVTGCRSPREHAPRLLALLDGLMVNQLFQPATALSDGELVDELESFFASC